MKYLFLIITLMLLGCSTTQQTKLKMCTKACKEGLQEFSDDDFTCRCYNRSAE